MKGKEALAHQKVLVLNLNKRVNDLDKEVHELLAVQMRLQKENSQLASYKDRMKIVVEVTNENITLKRLLENANEQARLWEQRTWALAIPANEVPEHLFSKDSLAVLADLKMLPGAVKTNRSSRRSTVSGAAFRKHSGTLDGAIEDIQGHGIKTKVQVV